VEPPKSAPVTAAPDPFREAELLNAVPNGERRRRPGLIQRMTGTGWSRRESAEPPRTAVNREKPASPAAAPAAAPAAVAVAEPPPRVDPVSAQPRLKGVDAHDRLPSSQGEDDLLDIPAFLRRQAN
jgi:cell division protein FtsZ